MGLISFGVSFGRAPSGTTCCMAGYGSFSNQVALELGERGEDMEYEAAARRHSFHLLGERLELDRALFHVSDGVSNLTRHTSRLDQFV